jgi:hypothetical protein
MNGDLARADALRLMGALVRAGAPDHDMGKASISEIAFGIGLDGWKLDKALMYADGHGWIDRGAREGWTRITPAGIAVGTEAGSPQ